MLINEAQRAQFREEGYFILERVIPDDVLTMLREECAYFVGTMDGWMDALGVTTIDLNRRGNRYFVSKRYRQSARLHSFLFGPVMAEVVRAALGPDAFLFNEQWVVKGAEQGMKFAWHQDSGYVKHVDPQAPLPPYLTCWCPLDDVSEENGTVYLLPHSTAGTRETVFDHTQEADTNDLIGYRGDEPGIAVTVPAGSVVAFTSYSLHRSGPNRSARMRRVYLAQYSSQPLRTSAGALWAMAVPFLRDGRVVYDRAQDTGR
jgi:ectoine hydroxylase-related dioxygenase (phytanoyl-CoA dioxygenase family)